MPPASSIILAGLHISKNGFSIDDAQLTVLRHVLTEFKVRTKEDAQHVVGVIQYCYSAFRWEGNQSLLEYSKLISTLTSSWKGIEGQKTHIKWSPECHNACVRLHELIYSQPRSYWNPNCLLTGDYSLAIMTDACDTAVGLSMFLVNRPNAKLITNADLRDHSISQLIATKSITLDAGQLRWHTCETELLGIVEAVIRWGNFISIALSSFSPDPLGETAKLLFLSDSTTGISQWLSLHIPEGIMDHLSAKARRFYSWADKVAGTQYWPMSIRHIPGTEISLPHMLSHLGDQLRDRHHTFQTVGVSMSVLPIAIHSFHADPRAQKPSASDIPAGFELHHLLLQSSDYVLLQTAYLNGTSTFNGISVSDIYRVLTNIDAKHVSSTTVQKITPWIGTIFFVAIPSGSSVPLVYTLASHQRLSPGNHEIPAIDRTKHLVMVCPKSASIQITNLEQIIDPAASSMCMPETSTTDIIQHTPIGTHYMDHDLIKDIVLLCHNVNNHPSVALTILLVQDLIWFPKLIEYVTDHVHSCPLCIPKRQAYVGVGTSILAAVRLSVLYLDHKVLDHDIRTAAAPYTAVLTMMCGAIRFVQYVCVRSMDAQTTARAILNEWYPLSGVPHSIRSDGAFGSEVLAAVRSLLGIKEWDSSSPNDPKHHSLLEHKHKKLDTILNDAFNKGDINGPYALKFYVKQAMACQNLLIYTDGYCAFTRLTGEQPRTPIDVATMDQPNIHLDNASPCDKKFIADLQGFLRNIHLWTHCINDARCKLDQATKLGLQNKKCSTIFDFKVHDIASYQGHAVTILDLIDPCASGFMNALIRRIDHDGTKEKQVKYSDLLPVGTLFPEKMLPASIPVNIDQFYFFDALAKDGSISSAIKAGKLLQHDSSLDMCIIQEYLSTSTNECHYQPTWLSPQGEIVRSRTPKKSFSPNTISVHQSALRLQTSINKAGYIPKMSLQSLTSQGIDMTSSRYTSK